MVFSHKRKWLDTMGFNKNQMGFGVDMIVVWVNKS